MRVNPFRHFIFLFLFLPSVSLACIARDPDLRGKYSGDCVNGYAEGEGVAQGRDLYKGSFHDGNPNGHGIYTWGQSEWKGDVFDGYFVNGDRIYGRYTFADGTIQEGNFAEGRLHGIGKLSIPKGSKRNSILQSIPREHWILIDDKIKVEGCFFRGAFLLPTNVSVTCTSAIARESDRARVEAQEKNAKSHSAFCKGVLEAQSKINVVKQNISTFGPRKLYEFASLAVSNEIPNISRDAFYSMPREAQEDMVLSNINFYSIESIMEEYNIASSDRALINSILSSGDSDNIISRLASECH